ncbi:MAG: N-6 DNA methylase, partial [Bacteroidaceae bacterium]
NKKDPNLFDSDAIKAKEQELKIAKHKIFGAKTVKTKRKYRQMVNDLRLEIAEMLKECEAVGNEEAQQLASWDMFDQNASSPFFDSEWMFGVKDGFDIVIANPPYISAPDQVKDDLLNKQRKYLVASKRFETLYQKWDLYVPFMEYALKSLCKNGSFSMIVPYPITNQLYGKVFRKWVMENYKIYEIVDLNGTKIFENATVSNVILFIQKGNKENATIISKINSQKIISHCFIQEYTNLVQDEKTEVWNLSQEQHRGNKHSDLNVLGDFCYISVGMVLNADEKKAKGEFSKTDLISDIKDEIHSRAYIEAKDIDRYKIKRVRFLEYDTERCPNKLRRPTFRELYNCDKLIFNRLGEIQVAIDNKEHYLQSDSSFLAIRWQELYNVNNKSITSSILKFSRMTRKDMEKLSSTVDLRFLLGVMNSRYAKVLLNNLRGGDYHIYPEHIRNIPIPYATKEQQNQVIAIVDRILELKEKDSFSDTSSLEFNIDRLVYKLYGLTYDEVKIVDPDTPITEEEYEN